MPSFAQPSWNTIGRESYLALGGNSAGGLCSTAANMGGNPSAEALTPRLMGYGSGSALYLQSGGSGGALPTLSPAEPPSPRWTKPGSAADTNARS